MSVWVGGGGGKGGGVGVGTGAGVNTDSSAYCPHCIAITSLGEERANLSAFRTFVIVWICRFPLPLGVWEGLRFVIVARPGLFSYLF